MRDVRVTAVIPSSVEILSVVPTPSRREGGIVEWKPGTLEFQAPWGAYVLLRPVHGGTWLVRANLTYTDEEGTPYADATQEAIRVVQPSDPGPTFPSEIAVILAVVLIAGAILAPLILWRRRNRRVPP
jgi:hypothetical protein